MRGVTGRYRRVYLKLPEETWVVITKNQGQSWQLTKYKVIKEREGLAERKKK